MPRTTGSFRRATIQDRNASCHELTCAGLLVTVCDPIKYRKIRVNRWPCRCVLIAGSNLGRSRVRLHERYACPEVSRFAGDPGGCNEGQRQASGGGPGLAVIERRAGSAGPAMGGLVPVPHDGWYQGGAAGVNGSGSGDVAARAMKLSILMPVYNEESTSGNEEA